MAHVCSADDVDVVMWVDAVAIVLIATSILKRWTLVVAIEDVHRKRCERPQTLRYVDGVVLWVNEQKTSTAVQYFTAHMKSKSCFRVLTLPLIAE